MVFLFRCIVIFVWQMHGCFSNQEGFFGKFFPTFVLDVSLLLELTWKSLRWTYFVFFLWVSSNATIKLKKEHETYKRLLSGRSKVILSLMRIVAKIIRENHLESFITFGRTNSRLFILQCSTKAKATTLVWQNRSIEIYSAFVTVVLLLKN